MLQPFPYPAASQPPYCSGAPLQVVWPDFARIVMALPPHLLHAPQTAVLFVTKLCSRSRSLSLSYSRADFCPNWSSIVSSWGDVESTPSLSSLGGRLCQVHVIHQPANSLAVALVGWCCLVSTSCDSSWMDLTLAYGPDFSILVLFLMFLHCYPAGGHLHSHFYFHVLMLTSGFLPSPVQLSSS